MSRIVADSEVFSSLKGKTVVITGGATGIGRAFVHDAHRLGANVVVADVAVESGESLAASLGPSVLFVRCDTTSYQDQLSLFSKAQETFGNIDVVIANAAVVDYTDYFAPVDDITSEPPFRELNVNLRGVMFTARIGMHYLRKSGGGDLILLSSIAGFKESAEMTSYLASKHGVIGVMRGLRLSTLPQGIRVNVICPWMTRTGMTKGIEKGWIELNLPVNEPEDVARAMLICATSNSEAARNSHFKDQPPFHGKILFIAGGESYEIEDKLQALEPEWLGQENSRVLKLGQDYLHNGSTSWGY
ncbi:related to 3-hydroxyacyl-CoA dehydrogenase [Cephalotrichum gorgonifer]|uniref:Related to 3-hydroxyacyl-CoA dehydrogenase n=1 Tax=Cephalotrichum gorgonifer TaxID=2041049 RepID=A0AAE8SUQ0_9PEZI|nr:related to 3-hydroxyacyl-CoA dehydrogenase [Cephalotrichum gorgonifer]